MKRKFIYSFIVLAILLTFTVLFLINTNGETSSEPLINKEVTEDEAVNFDSSNVKFALWDADVRLIGEKSSETLNLIFVSPPSYVEDIQAIYLKNNKSLNVKDYTINQGDTIDENNSLFNIFLTIQAKEPNNFTTTTINEIIIVTMDNVKHTFPVGNISVKKGARGELLKAYEEYGVSYESFNFNTTLKNFSNSAITLKDIFINNKQIEFKDLKINGEVFKGSTSVDPEEVIKISSSFNLPDEVQEFDFYQITPTIKYEVNGETKLINLDSVYYDLLKIDQNKINSIMNRK